MSTRILAALTAADFRERTRRPAYLVTLAAAVILGYLALPPASSLYVIMNAGGYRGIYNSAYAGTATALAGGLWLMLAGFYVVRGTIDRDQHTGVGQILAATPLRNAGYLTGKFLSNLLVLASTTVGIQRTRALLSQVREVTPFWGSQANPEGALSVASACRQFQRRSSTHCEPNLGSPEGRSIHGIREGKTAAQGGDYRCPGGRARSRHRYGRHGRDAWQRHVGIHLNDLRDIAVKLNGGDAVRGPHAQLPAYGQRCRQQIGRQPCVTARTDDRKATSR